MDIENTPLQVKVMRRGCGEPPLSENITFI